ncbi:MAG: hypothetical protein LBV36_01830 [Chromatiales bacterium]|jgi:multiple antibiotic resistance protein|nr:hypothetical protein [Chromatiales bacterium]
MTEPALFSSFLHVIALAFIALFPPVNPIGSALIVEPFLHQLSDKERWNAAWMITFYCLIICLGSVYVGGVFFSAFGISVPVVQMAGGILICRLGWSVLASNQLIDQEKEVAAKGPVSQMQVRNMLFYPLAFPTTTGGGTISVLLTLSAGSYELVPLGTWAKMLALTVACLLMCLLIFVCHYFAPTLFRRLGTQGQQVVNKLSGFLTFCVGIQIFVNGLLALIRTVK